MAENLQRLILKRIKATKYFMSELKMYIILLRNPFLLSFPFAVHQGRTHEQTFPELPAEPLISLEVISQRAHYKVYNALPKSRELPCLTQASLVSLLSSHPYLKVSMQICLITLNLKL